MSLTDDGRKLLPQVGSALGILSAATDTFDTGPAANLLTIAASISVTQWVIAPNLAAFTQRHPNIRIRFLSAIWPDDFNSARADVEIRFGSEKQAGKNAKRLNPNRLVAVKAPSVAGDLHSLPLIEAVGTSSGWKEWAAKIGKVPEPQLFADSYGVALHLASQGNGVALVSELLIQYAVEAGVIEHAHPASIPGNEGYYLSIDEGNAQAMQFRTWLLEQLAFAGSATEAEGA
nr:LysR substrate-binding domain-containing protein [Yoonia sediminilitoris]